MYWLLDQRNERDLNAIDRSVTIQPSLLNLA
jgi:hypothetical protein